MAVYKQSDITQTTYSDDGETITVVCTIPIHTTGQTSFSHNDDGTVTEENTLQPIIGNFSNTNKNWLACVDESARISYCLSVVASQNPDLFV